MEAAEHRRARPGYIGDLLRSLALPEMASETPVRFGHLVDESGRTPRDARLY